MSCCFLGVFESSWGGIGVGTVSSCEGKGGVVDLNLSLASTSDPNRPRSSSVSDTLPSPHSTRRKKKYVEAWNESKEHQEPMECVRLQASEESYN